MPSDAFTSIGASSIRANRIASCNKENLMASDNYSDDSLQGCRLHTPILAFDSFGNEEHLLLTNHLIWKISDLQYIAK